MPNALSIEALDRMIHKLPGKPIVLEALWTGDTEGWYLLLYLYTSTGWFMFQLQHRHLLSEITCGGDIRLFNGAVPPWPEAELAKEIGAKAESKYGLTFYMQSEEPDYDCPSWMERDKAINCADCNKLIIPTDSQYFPKDICYSCHLRREFKMK
jgi:hypothetical protein